MPEAASPVPASPVPGPPGLRAVITDWGGVMTNPIVETVSAWLNAERVDPASYRAVMGPWVADSYAAGSDGSPIHLLERGEISCAEFEAELARHLVGVDGEPVPAAGLLDRMFAATTLEPAMLDLVRAVRGRGLRTALLSNSWGVGAYPQDLLPELYDVTVISAEVGMRKPEERIFRHTADLLGVQPGECVFIDDIEANVRAAQAAGLTALHHRRAEPTAEWLSRLLGLPPLH